MDKISDKTPQFVKLIIMDVYNFCKMISDNLITLIYIFMYGLMCFYTYILTLFKVNNNKSVLKKIQLHKNYSEFIEYKYYNLGLNTHNPEYDFKFIKILYTINNKDFILIIKSDNVKDINTFYPPYKPDELQHINLNMNGILSGTVKINNEEIDITNELNKLAGPMRDFYKSIKDYNLPEIQDIWGYDANSITFLTDEVKEFTINSVLELN
jgi:hypothetical protein